MTPLIHIILTWEREMEISQQERKLHDSEVIINKPVPCHKQKSRKRFFSRLRSEKSCECS
jgi:hypothetical protein